jgi:hypothetical protein
MGKGVGASMIQPDQLRSVIQRTLKKFEELGGATYSEEAVELLMMVAAHESKLLTYVRQLEGGPALGVYQHEPETIRDLYRVVISKNQKLDFAVAKFVPSAKSLTARDYSELVETDLRYATVLARVHFMRFKEPIPKGAGMAAYAKKYWNTEAGSATEDDYVKAYVELC